MYLTCPNCETVYTVRAAMLKEGQGEVRCGACHTLFNALDHLSDELPEQLAREEPHGRPIRMGVVGEFIRRCIKRIIGRGRGVHWVLAIQSGSGALLFGGHKGSVPKKFWPRLTRTIHKMKMFVY